MARAVRESAEAWDLAASCETMLVVGASGLVHPAAQLPYIAREASAAVIEVNPDASEIPAVARIVCRGPAGRVLAALIAACEGEAA